MTDAPSDFDRHHIKEILSDPARYDWFSAQLIRLIQHADAGNRAKLRTAYPNHVAAFEDWYYQRGPYAPQEEAAT